MRTGVVGCFGGIAASLDCLDTASPAGDSFPTIPPAGYRSLVPRRPSGTCGLWRGPASPAANSSCSKRRRKLRPSSTRRRIGANSSRRRMAWKGAPRPVSQSDGCAHTHVRSRESQLDKEHKGADRGEVEPAQGGPAEGAPQSELRCSLRKEGKTAYGEGRQHRWNEWQQQQHRRTRHF